MTQAATKTFRNADGSVNLERAIEAGHEARTNAFRGFMKSARQMIKKAQEGGSRTAFGATTLHHGAASHFGRQSRRPHSAAKMYKKPFVPVGLPFRERIDGKSCSRMQTSLTCTAA